MLPSASKDATSSTDPTFTLSPAGSARYSGILLHISSLPPAATAVDTGLGDLGPGAREFIDYLQAAGQSCWQVLPIGPTGYGNSPYASYSAFAGNPDFISLEDLLQRGYLQAEHLPAPRRRAKHKSGVEVARDLRNPVLRRAWQRFVQLHNSDDHHRFEQFIHTQAWWLNDFAEFMTLKNMHGNAAWYTWRAEYKLRDAQALSTLRQTQAEEINYHKFLQWLFDEQWRALRSYAHSRAVQLIGDIPIFCADDSADVWAQHRQFLLDDARRPGLVAGVPPDYFSKTGQRWGNPLYDWEVMQSDNFSWWAARLQRMRDYFDVLRIDHFRGFEAFWAIPAADKTAVNGSWLKAPGQALFAELGRRFGELGLIAEDLGLITPEVTQLRIQAGFPGMKVLQFAYESCDPRNEFLPHNYSRDCVVYTGTHDNLPSLAWHRAAAPQVKDFVEQYLGARASAKVVWKMLRAALASPAYLCLFPLQDLLGQGKDQRMNAPGQARGNWLYRCEAEDLTPERAARLRVLTQLYNRYNPA